MGCALQGSGERNHRRLQFGQFEADLEKQQLYKRGLPLRLENLPFRLLVALLERPGSAVSREELRLRLWPDGIHVDFDEGLNTAVRKLRHALEDSADTPLFIETVPRKGYMLIAPVAEARSSTGVETDPQLMSARGNGNGFGVDVRPAPTTFAISLFLGCCHHVAGSRLASSCSRSGPRLRRRTGLRLRLSAPFVDAIHCARTVIGDPASRSD